ncbi:MAG TPA: SGNH/GDSL hydrolase family protein [Chroococcales cyanobacterium]|jgi:phospholipase/lecithinase/hemolysin
MKKQILAGGFVLFCVLSPLKALAASFSSMYVFGDSLSDTGNTFNVSKALTGTGYPQPPYFEGHLSNGPNWVDYLAEDLGLNPVPVTTIAPGVLPTEGINFAFAGATTGTDNTVDPRLPALQQEITAFQGLLAQTAQPADPNALYIVWAGANDYLPTQSTTFTPFTTPGPSISNLSFALNTLVQAGAKNLMVVNLPNLGELPLTRNTPISQGLNSLAQAHNAQLTTLTQSLGSDVNVTSVDVNTLFTNAINNPAQFGFTNVTDPCFNNITVCNSPNQYLFWDGIHPTTATHQFIADLAFNSLNSEPSQSVPEPTSVLGLLVFSVLGSKTLFKSKFK